MDFKQLFKRREAGQDKPDSWRSSLVVLLAALVLASFITLFGLQSYRVDGESMENTLDNGDRLVIDKLPRTLSRITRHAYVPHRGDIIVFNEPGLFGPGSATSEQLIKRVIGLPGERVVIKNGQLTVYNAANPNGFDPDQSSGWQLTGNNSPGQVDQTLGQNQIFVLGDNRSNSTDSHIFGPIYVNQIIGKLVYRISPWDEPRRF